MTFSPDKSIHSSNCPDLRRSESQNNGRPVANAPTQTTYGANVSVSPERIQDLPKDL